jgi:predicted nucleic acid-binding protein
VTESDVLFDTWAWWEYLFDTATGRSLRDRFVKGDRYRIHASAITLGELGGRLCSDGFPDRAIPVCGSIRRMSHVWDVTADIAQDAGLARAKLRAADAGASLADAIVYVTALRAGARIVSADPAFRSLPGVIDH